MTTATEAGEAGQPVLVLSVFPTGVCIQPNQSVFDQDPEDADCACAINRAHDQHAQFAIGAVDPGNCKSSIASEQRKL